MLNGELWVSSRTSAEVAVSIWSTTVHGSHGVFDQGRWERRYSIPFAAGVCRPTALVPGGRLFLRYGNVLYGYERETKELTTVCEMDSMRYKGRRRGRKWKNLWSFHVLPYTESLLRITALVMYLV